MLTSGGHNAGIVSEPGHPHRSFQIHTRVPGEPYMAPDVWQAQAQTLMQQLVAKQPVLVQISAAKQLRDQAERLSRQQGAEEVQSSHVERAGRELGWVVSA